MTSAVPPVWLPPPRPFTFPEPSRLDEILEAEARTIRPAQSLLVVPVLYFAFLFPLSTLSRKLERKGRRTEFSEQRGIVPRSRSCSTLPATAS
jgi:hypothetical protein